MSTDVTRHNANSAAHNTDECSGVARNFSQGVRNAVISKLQPTSFTISGLFPNHCVSHCPRGPGLVSMYLRWGSSSFDIVGADTRKLRGPKCRVLVHEMIRSRRSVDRSLPRMIGRPLASGLYWCAYIHRLDTVRYEVKCNQRNLELDAPRTVGVTSTSSRWMNVCSESRAALDRRTHHLPHFLNRNFTEVAEQQTFMANIRRRRR